MTIQHKNKAINIYYPNENMIKNNKTKNEDVLYIDDSEMIRRKLVKKMIRIMQSHLILIIIILIMKIKILNLPKVIKRNYL